MKTLLKKMKVALLALGIGQAALADDVPNLKQIVQKAEAGEEDAQVALGSMYFKGVGVRQSDQEAVRWYRKAAEQGQAEAQYNLCMMYYVGQDVNQDHEKAMEMYF